MSKVKPDTPNLDISRSFWLDLETPYGLIDDEWDRYRSQLNQYVIEDYRISKELLKVHWCLERELSQIPYEREPLLSHILDDNEEYGKNILCAYRFANGKNKKRVVACFEEIEGEVAGADFITLYEDIMESGSRDAMVSMIQLFKPEVLRNILGLQYCYGRKPQLIRHSESKLEKLDALNIDKVAESLEHITDSYRPWHSFTHDEKLYFLIKRRLGDEVERQVDENLEEEPAEFVVLIFDGTELQIFSEKKKIASNALSGINEAIEQTFQEEEDDDGIDEDEIEDHQFDDMGQELTYEELKSAIGLAKDIEDNTDLVLKGVNVENADLPNSPEIQLKANEGVQETLDWFEERNVELLNHPDDVKNITFVYEGRDFTLLPREGSSKGEEGWIFRYNASYPSDEEREEFEGQIKEYMDVEVRFEKS
ncbi:hypothetical protein [Natrinema sp. DC36]|uniref:hypothetical protein n=1 Tax=Natrinema sp. DC36 TaxID=2878680 RepID=UPI001CF03212|nr:hypothetical protein [Natrinema sp. DC36]